MPPLPKIARVAAWVALVMGALMLFSFTTNAILNVAFGLMSLAGGFEIFRRHRWGAYGLALYWLSQLFVLAVVFMRSSPGSAERPWFLPLAFVNVAMVVLFWLAGRALSQSQANSGWAGPWIAVSLALVLFFAVCQPFVIPTASMEKTLLVGDRIVIRRWPKPSLERGDLAVFLNPVDHRQTYVKRVVGKAGDHIKLSNKILIRNGKPVPEPYVFHGTDYIDAYRDNFPAEANIPLTPSAQEMLARDVVSGEVIVPAGKYFMMGDNRDSSYDSRYYGFVSSAEIIGKPLLIYDSRDKTRIRWNRFFRVL